jgi:hypothetical protein
MLAKEGDGARQGIGNRRAHCQEQRSQQSMRDTRKRPSVRVHYHQCTTSRRRVREGLARIFSVTA